MTVDTKNRAMMKNGDDTEQKGTKQKHRDPNQEAITPPPTRCTCEEGVENGREMWSNNVRQYQSGGSGMNHWPLATKKRNVKCERRNHECSLLYKKKKKGESQNATNASLPQSAHLAQCVQYQVSSLGQKQ